MKIPFAKLTLRPETLDMLGPCGGTGSPVFEQAGAQTRIRRAPVRAIATYQRAGSGGGDLFGQVLNLGLQGCLLRTEATILQGTQLQMTITIVGKAERTSAAVTGQVVRVTEHEGRKAYGVEFLAQTTREKETQQWLYAHATTTTTTTTSP